MDYVDELKNYVEKIKTDGTGTIENLKSRGKDVYTDIRNSGAIAGFKAGYEAAMDNMKEKVDEIKERKLTLTDYLIIAGTVLLAGAGIFMLVKCICGKKNAEDEITAEDFADELADEAAEDAEK
ncbi:MAG TPA: hypothetical protein PLN48_10840 [Lachnospiraceae bacterium]|nr:hypothetical protein [Lachnospiraceae bacterium]